MRARIAVAASLAIAGGAGCSGDDASSPATGADASIDGASAIDATTNDAPGDVAVDAPHADAGTDAAARVLSYAIATADGGLLQGAPGDGVSLVIVMHMSDGTTQLADPSAVTWTAPITLVAEDPYDAGPNIVPEAGASPTAFYVENDLRGSAPGTLFIADRGTGTGPVVTVGASIADAGAVSAVVAVLPSPVGDPDAGGRLFQTILVCTNCHGADGEGSPLATLPDGGPELLDGGPAWVLGAQLYPYPAPGLNAKPGSGNVADDPSWNPALFAIAAQSDMDNHGVALRFPMPMWLGGNDGTGAALDAKDFADIYAWLKTQTK